MTSAPIHTPTIISSIKQLKVPHEVQVVAERYCKKRETTQEEDIALDMCNTYCQQESSVDFHKAGQERAMTEVAALYEAVKNMPDGPQKSLFLKKVCLPIRYDILRTLVTYGIPASLRTSVLPHRLPSRSPELKATRFVLCVYTNRHR